MSPKIGDWELSSEVPEIVVASMRVKLVHQVEDGQPAQLRPRWVGTSGLEADTDATKLLDASLANLEQFLTSIIKHCKDQSHKTVEYRETIEWNLRA